MSGDEQAIRELVTTWSEATAAGDVDAVLALIAEDAVFHVTGRPPFGKQAFAEAQREALEQVRIEAQSEIEELEVMGEFAYLRNHLHVTVTPRGGALPLRRTGYTLTILRKGHDGKWRLIRDANLLAPEAEANH